VSEPVILASILPGEPIFESEQFEVWPIECVEPENYWEGVAEWWDSDRVIVNLEHDVECSDELIQTLLDCDCAFGTWAYWLGIPSGGPHWAHRTGKQPPCGGAWIETGDEWADFGGIGFCKIEPSARVRPLWEPKDDDDEPPTWQEVDIAVFASVHQQVHVHWPAVEHLHS
jgi:hypothetical protein